MSSRENRRMPQSVPKTRGRTIFGHAAKFGKLSRNLGGPRNPWYEELVPGCFPDLSTQNVVALVDHDKSRILARSRNGKGTLKLTVDNIGLRYEFEAPDTQAGNDILESIRRGDVDGASFSFVPEKDEWTTRGNKKVRRILKMASLHDVSIVVEPAYEAATAGARSVDKLDPEVADWRARLGMK